MACFNDVTEITAWQLAHKLNLRVDLFVLSPDFRRHFKRVDRLSDVATSAPRTIAEGFSGDPRSFADRVRIAKGSQAEVLAHLNDAYMQRLITLDEWQIAERLARRSLKAASGLIRTLESPGDAATATREKNRRRIRRAPTSWD